MRESIKDKVFQLLLTVMLVLFAVAVLLPVISVLATSFSSRVPVDMDQVTLWPVGFTLDSWKFVLTNKPLWNSFFITSITTGVGVFLALLISSMMAYALSKQEFMFRRIITVAVILTMIFKAPIVPYFLVLRSIGLYNNPIVLFLPHILSAYNLAIMITFFRQFPVDIEEAAMIDGCGKFKTLFNIVIPSSKAVLATVGMFYGVGMWNQFQNPLMFIQDADLFPLQLKIRQLISGGQELINVTKVNDLNYSPRTLRSVIVIFGMLPIIIVYPKLQKYFTKGAMLGSVKG